VVSDPDPIKRSGSGSSENSEFNNKWIPNTANEKVSYWKNNKSLKPTVVTITILKLHTKIHLFQYQTILQDLKFSLAPRNIVALHKKRLTIRSPAFLWPLMFDDWYDITVSWKSIPWTFSLALADRLHCKSVAQLVAGLFKSVPPT
jgi:hypothetical protein